MLRTSGSKLVQYKPARNNAVTVTLTFTTTKSWLGSFTPPSYVPPRLPLSSLRGSSVIQSTYLRVYRPRSFRVFFVCGRNVFRSGTETREKFIVQIIYGPTVFTDSFHATRLINRELVCYIIIIIIVSHSLTCFLTRFLSISRAIVFF